MKTNLLLVAVFCILNLFAFGKNFQVDKGALSKNANDTIVIKKINNEVYICTCKPDICNPSGEGITYFQGLYNEGNYKACDERLLIQWDLSELPKGIKIIEAKMMLYCTDFVGNKQGQFLYEYISEPWNKDIGYSKKPNTSGDNKILTALPKEGQYHIIDVTNFVEKWHNKKIPNYGLMGYGFNMKTTTSAKFCSSKFPDKNKRPMLLVIYQNR